MIYREPRPIDRKAVEEALSGRDADRAAESVIRMAMNDPDFEWAQRICLRAVQDVRTEVVLAGLIGLGHLARRFRRLDLKTVLPAVRFRLKDKTFAGVAEDVLDDIGMFVHMPNERC